MERPPDDIDLQILRLLREDGRMTVSDLAQVISVSRPNAYARLKELTNKQVLKGFSAQVDSDKLGLGIVAIVALTVEQPARAALEPFLRDMPEVEYAGFTTGETDVLVIVRARSVEHLRDEIIWALEEHPSVSTTRTTLILSEIVKRPYVLPD